MRLRLPVLLLSGVVVASSACSDGATTSPLTTPESAGFSRSSNTSGPSGARLVDEQTQTYTFSIDPTRRNHLEFGPHSLDLPANAVCVGDSGYGPAWWDAPCVTSTSRTTITVVVTNPPKGLPRIDLQPEIRFSPRTTVELELYVKNMPKSMATYSVLYCASPTAVCVDESLNDSTLASQYDRSLQEVIRRIKHFSGYLVAERE
jgi:hypothetical protein